MRVLQLVNAYPTELNAVKGVFIKDQVELMRSTYPELDIDVFSIDTDDKGYFAYLYAFLFLVKNGNKYEVIHAHHVFCGLVAIMSGLGNRLLTSFLSDSYNEVMIGPVFFRRCVFNFVRRFSKCKIYKVKNNFIDDKRSFFLPNPVDTEFFFHISKKEARKLIKLEEDGVYALFVSGQSLARPEKRYDLFCNIVNIYNRDHNKKIKPLAVSNVEREKLRIYYNACDFYLLTSDFEGSPNAVKECLACGTSVVSRKVGSVDELLGGLDGMAIVDSDSPVDYINKIDYVLSFIKPLSYHQRLQNLNLDPLSSASKLMKIYREVAFENL